MTGTPGWGGGAANEEAWRITGSDYEFVYATFELPANYASGPITPHVWWVTNVAAAADFYIDVSIQSVMTLAQGAWYWYWAGGSSVAIDDVGAVHDVHRTTIANGTVSAGKLGSDYSGQVFHAIVGCLNATAEDIGIMGLELEYTGYV
jgi:hypothetical protein